MIVNLKTKEEIGQFSEAGKIARNILEKILTTVSAGVTTKELDELAREECNKNSVKPIFLGYMGFPAAICASVNDVLVHGVPNDEPLKVGDVVSIDIGVETDGFIGDVARTVCVDSEDTDLVKQCRFALEEATKVAIDGNRLRDIAIAVETVANNGKYKIPKQYGGHGIDRYKLHSDPFVHNIQNFSEDIILREGMIIAIEPMFIDAPVSTLKVAEDHWTVVAAGPAAHFENTILVGKEARVLTRRSDG